MGGWRYSRGHSRRGTSAPPPTGCGRCGGWRTPPSPPPPPGRARAWGEARGRALPVGGAATTGGTPAPGAEGPLPRHADPGTHCGRVASGGPLSARGGLPAATNQGQRARQGGKGGDGPDRSGALLDTPGADGGGDGRGTSPGDSPPGVAPVSGPPTWLEGVYTPTAHEGAPGRGGGTGSPPGAGACPGSGTRPHAIMGGWRYSRGAAAAAPRLLLAPGVTRTVAGAPPPPAPRPPPVPPPPAIGSAAASRGRRRLPFRAPAVARRSPRRRPLRRPARPPLDGGRGRQPDPGAAGLWPTAILQACLAAPLTYLPAPCGRRWPDLCGGWGLTSPPQRARAPGQGHPPPGAGPSPPSCC